MTNKLTFITLSLLLLSSCANMINRNLELIESESATLISEEHIDEGDVFYSASANALVKINSLKNSFTDPFAMNMGIGASGRFHSIKKGELFIDFYVPIVYKDLAFDESILQSERTISPIDLSAIVSLPVFHFTVNKRRPLSAKNEENKPYLLYTNIPSYHKINVRLGLISDYKRTFSTAYSDQLEEQPNFNYFNDIQSPIAEINQRNTTLKIGGSYQIAIKSKILAITESKMKFNASRSQIIDFYFDINILLTNKGDGIQYDYTFTNESGIPESTSESVIPSSFLNRQAIGFSLGYEITSSSIGEHKLTGHSAEIGIIPGMYSKTGLSPYFKFCIKFGRGKWK